MKVNYIYVIELRKNFYEDSARHKNIASSFLDTEWFEQIEVRDGLLFLAGGVFMYFNEKQIKEFFKKVADFFKKCDFVFILLNPNIPWRRLISDNFIMVETILLGSCFSSLKTK